VATASARLRVRSTITIVRARPRTTATNAQAHPTLLALTILIFMVKSAIAKDLTNVHLKEDAKFSERLHYRASNADNKVPVN
jgi:hypothetical protein